MLRGVVLGKSAISIAFLAASVALVVWNFGISGIVASARNLSLYVLAATFLFLILNALVAALRFKVIARDVGHAISFRRAVAAVSVGSLAGTLFFQLAGQLMARGMMMNRAGIPFASVVVMTLYERAVAAAVSGLLALAGAYFIFGQILLDQRSGGGEFIKIVLGLIVATTAGALFGYGRRATQAVSPMLTRHFAVRLLGSIALSLVVQIPMLTAYVVIVHALSPAIPLPDLAAAAVLVMFAASIPISLAGWGIRELSAVFALGAIGVKTAVALVAALLIGAGSLLAMAVLAGLSFTSWRSGPTSDAEVTSAPINYSTLLAWSLPLAAATLVLFQLYIPISSGTLLNVNLADPIVILGGSYFLLQAFIRRQPPRWRSSNINLSVIGITAILAVSLISGATRFGYTEWSVVNRFLGWFVLLAYASTAALLVKESGQVGFRTLLLTFAAATAAVVALEIVFVLIKVSGLPGLLPVHEAAVQGFAQNRNFFAFQILMAMCATLSVVRQPRLRILFMTIFIAGLWLCGSRSGWGAVIVLIAAALWRRTATFREIAVAVVAASLLIFALAIIIPVVIPLFLSAGPGSHVVLPNFVPEQASTAERLRSIRIGWEMFTQYPIFGAGLGAFRNLKIVIGNDPPLLIHSTALWIMAEMGIVGLLIYAYPALSVLIGEIRRKRHDRASQLIILSFLAFAVMATPADMFYQRTFWLLIGGGLALPVEDTRVAA
jgi:O-antigen ligase/uncharacterized membrane protein YbhN (UPF0104 family)